MLAPIRFDKKEDKDRMLRERWATANPERWSQELLRFSNGETYYRQDCERMTVK